MPQPLDDADELVLGEIRSRLRYLATSGLRYLTLDRQSRTLSGGEVQRINLTTALGTSLVNTLFVLDEPSVGLHPRDLGRIVERAREAARRGQHAARRRARRAGHARRGSHHRHGARARPGRRRRSCSTARRPSLVDGRRVADGEVSARRARASSAARAARAVARAAIRGSSIRGAREHNLRNVDAAIPLNRLVCITGVSGSGKSTLVEDVLYNGLLKLLGKPKDAPGAHAAIEGFESLADVVLVDQAPIGRTTRSNPASFVGVLEPIRKLFAAEPLARERSYTAGTFSFNTRQRALPRVLRQRLRARRDAVPERRLLALRRVQRPPLSQRGARREARARLRAASRSRSPTCST